MDDKNNSKFPAAVPMETVKAAEGIYAVIGGMGANAGIIIGERSVIVIDAKMSDDSGRMLLKEIAKLTNAPVKRVILTHSDIDHVNGLTAFAQGIVITATQKTRLEMEADFKSRGESALLKYLPNDIYEKEKEIMLDGLQIRLFHADSGHTGGDTIVFIPERKLVFAGDLVFISRPSLIHRQKGGTAQGLINNLTFMPSLDADLFIGGHTEKVSFTPEGKMIFSGHVPFATRKDVEKLLDNIKTTRDSVAGLVKQGKTLYEVKVGLNINDTPAPSGRPRFPSIAEVIYLELTSK